MKQCSNEIMRLKIANWNIERPKLNTTKTKLVLNKINEINADIFVLTETSNAINLSNIFPYYVSTDSYSRTPDEQWVTIWSKYPIIQKFITNDNYRTVSAKISTPIGNTIIYGTIIPYHMAGVKGIRYGNLNYKPWQFHLEDINKQSLDWTNIINSNQDCFFILVGDFNQTRGINNGYGTTEARNLLSNKLSNLDLECLTIQNNIDSYLSIAPNKYEKRKNIDHICVSKKMINIYNKIDVIAWNHFTEQGKFMSDHNGVAIEINY
jgi:hypothetical protein